MAEAARDRAFGTEEDAELLKIAGKQKERIAELPPLALHELLVGIRGKLEKVARLSAGADANPELLPGLQEAALDLSAHAAAYLLATAKRVADARKEGGDAGPE